METGESQVRIIDGSLHVDKRGTVCFVNDFNFKGVDRFYSIHAHRLRELRGWVGHQRDHKWFFAAHGTTLVAVVTPDRWDRPTENLSVNRFVLSAAKPQVLHVPPGHATASVNLSGEAILMVFSSGRIEDAATDDYRFAVDTWPILGE
jgi:dTDP-4-dehydrorhamnose 3,5-epimerase-like enzyme